MVPTFGGIVEYAEFIASKRKAAEDRMVALGAEFQRAVREVYEP